MSSKASATRATGRTRPTAKPYPYADAIEIRPIPEPEQRGSTPLRPATST